MNDLRYDRQVRLWGNEGQHSIQSTTVCVIGSSALATEILKSLVLAGVQSVCVVDHEKVSNPDLGNNFFVTDEDVRKLRGEVVLQNLMELNPTVSGKFINMNIENIKDLSVFLDFSVVVGTNLREDISEMLSSFLFNSDVPYISIRVYGLLGRLQISVKEHFIINNHEENPKPDLRIDNPFPALREVVDAMLKDNSTENMRKLPYLFLYFKALEYYRNLLQDSTAFPSTFADRKKFLGALWDLRVPSVSGSVDSENFDEAKEALHRSMLKTTIPSDVATILNDEKCLDNSIQQPFWIFCAALRRFVEKHQVLPLSGVLPDMASDTKSYITISSIFHTKAQEDASEVLAFVKQIEKERGLRSVLTEEQCYSLCKNASRIRLQRGNNKVDKENNFKAFLEKLQPEYLESVSYPSPMVWNLLLKAADTFCRHKGRYPGTNGVPCTIDSKDLMKRVEFLIKASGHEVNDFMKMFPEAAIAEMCRYGAGEPHVIASLMGGIGAQEVIKLATNQYVPLNNILIFDGHTQMTETVTI